MSGEDTLFNLRWDAQRSAILSSVSDIFREESFVDITIVSEGQIFKAHRLILAASSPYLKQALLSVPAEHAVLLLPQVSSADMSNILKFIYQGEIKINQKALKSFIQVSKLLKIKGMDFGPEEEQEMSDVVSSKRISPDGGEEEPSKRLKSNADAKQLSPSTSSSGGIGAATTAAALIANAIQIDNLRSDRDHEHVPSSTADFQIGGGHHSYGQSTSSREDDDVKSEHLDFDKEIISLDEEEDEEDEEEFQEEEDEDQFPFQPEVSFQEGTWGTAAHSSSMPALHPANGGNNNKHRQQQLLAAAGKRPGGNSEGILQRMMREPLKSSAGSSMSISMAHGIPHVGHLTPFDLHDNIGLRKNTKRYVSCTHCSKVLSSLSALKRHMEDVHCARIQGKCIICGRVYSSRNSLLTHVYSAHKKHHDYKAVARIIRESDFEQFANV